MMFTLSRRPADFGLQCDEAGLSLAGVPFLSGAAGQFQPRAAAELEVLLNEAYGTDQQWDERIRGIGSVARALNHGDLSRGMIAALLLKLPSLDWAGAVRIANAEEALTKYGFNPAELRDWHGRWTHDREGSSPSEPPGDHVVDGAEDRSAEFFDVVYQGKFHDRLVEAYAEGLRALGCTVLTQIPITGVNGVTARADLLVLRPGEVLPMVIEVKTGRNPKYTNPQRSIYPLSAIGGHVTSSDLRVGEVGLVPGSPFPPLEVYTAYRPGPDSEMKLIPVLPEFLP